MENNLFWAPVYFHKAKETDFLCNLHLHKTGQKYVFLREIDYVYAVGQQEPLQEIYNPISRQFQAYQKRRIQAYVLRLLELNGRYPFDNLQGMFLIHGQDQMLKKALKEVDIEIDRQNYCV